MVITTERLSSLAETAETVLNELGYTNIIHFNGGMQAWARQGRRLLHRGP